MEDLTTAATSPKVNIQSGLTFFSVLFFALRRKAKCQSCKVSDSGKSPATSQVKLYKEVVLLKENLVFLYFFFQGNKKKKLPRILYRVLSLKFIYLFTELPI